MSPTSLFGARECANDRSVVIRRNGKQVLEEARRRDALRLIEHSGLMLEEIAVRLGQLSPANFTRAIRGPTGEAPSLHREMSATG